MTDLSDVPGLSFRPFQPDDLPAMVAIHHSREQHDQVDPLSDEQRTPTLPELEAVFTGRDDFDPAVQMLMACVNEQPVGYAWIRVWAQDETTWICFHRSLLRPEWRGLGIGMTLLTWAEDLLGAIAAQRPPGIEAQYRTTTSDTERETVARLERAGYTVGNVTYEMALPDLNDLAEPTKLPGIVIRAPLPDEYRQVYFANETAFVDEWGHVERTDEDFAAFMTRPDRDPSLWRVAWDGDSVAGVVMGEMGALSGLIAELSVGQAWRGRGLGRALLLHGLHALKERGAAHARLIVEASDSFGAQRLYESVGFRQVKTYLRYVKPVGD